MDRTNPHLPRPAPIEAYGNGGFRFAGMSHRGSLLCLPSGIWPSEITTPTQIEDVSFALVWDEQPAVDHCLIGTGRDPWIIPRVLHELFREHHIVVEAMTTGAAVRTYNILLSESRRIAALLIVVD